MMRSKRTPHPTAVVRTESESSSLRLAPLIALLRRSPRLRVRPDLLARITDVGQDVVRSDELVDEETLSQEGLLTLLRG